jgi:hypothetical protein
VLVTAASVHDSAGGTHLFDHLALHNPTVSKAWADNGYKNKAIEHAATRGIDLEIVQRDPTAKGLRGLVFSGQASDRLFHAAIRNVSYSAWTSRGGR